MSTILVSVEMKQNETKKKIFYAFKIDLSMKKSWRLLAPDVTYKKKRDV